MCWQYEELYDGCWDWLVGECDCSVEDETGLEEISFKKWLEKFYGVKVVEGKEQEFQKEVFEMFDKLHEHRIIKPKLEVNGILNFFDVEEIIEKKKEREREKDKEKGVEREEGDIEREVCLERNFITIDTLNKIRNEIEKMLDKYRKDAHDDSYSEGQFMAFRECLEQISQLTEDYDENGKN